MKTNSGRCRLAVAALALFSASLVAAGAEVSDSSDSDWIIHLQWRIDPSPDPSGNSFWNGTALYENEGDLDVPIRASFFTNETAMSWSVGLLFIGTNAWVDGIGWTDVSWLDTSPYILDAEVDSAYYLWLRQNGAPNGGIALPINLFGDFSSQTQINAKRKAYYLSRWASHFAVIVFREPALGRAHVLSETPGLAEYCLDSSDVHSSSVVGLFSLGIFKDSLKSPDGTILPSSQYYNSVRLIVSTPSRKVYIGPQIPPYCIWMADFGLTREELAQYPATRVQAAFEARVHPSDKSLDATLLLLQ